MKNFNGKSFDGRIKDASQAKQDQLERFKKAANDPERLATIAKRKADAAVRETQKMVKAAELLKRQEQQARIQAETEERDAALAAAQEAERKSRADKIIDQDQATEAEKKAERDRRYAARRNRKK